MSLEKACLTVLAEELGPAAKTFLDRQCRNHLHKEPSSLQSTDLEELTKWCVAGVQIALGAQIAENVKKGMLSIK